MASSRVIERNTIYKAPVLQFIPPTEEKQPLARGHLLFVVPPPIFVLDILPAHYMLHRSFIPETGHKRKEKNKKITVFYRLNASIYYGGSVF